ncbi:DNA adenine methylase [Mucilaginibacter jinjuensis]|uniref:site-specific DNA-methyltransferase (adenine-specific) n=1 Tax=Mucilaginibacter jinjuensis TaxID=1176721 RepID=A0ABY7T8M5_9SPHI|nr:DNA adenine methylase [Mucilaginibacter jinjuensis]WCT12598.1 DNA adenine methylase [Mucilaginibacter jinjuensis]
MERKLKVNKFSSPLRYPGGKSCIFPFVSNLFYENHLIGCSYAEPYAGGSGLALRLLFEEYVNRIYINDFDKAIYAFWVTIINRPEEFCKWIETVDVSIENWNKYKAIQNDISNADNFELAQSTFFLNRTNISGVIKGGIIGGYDQSGKYKIDARFNKKDLIDRIKKIASFKHRIFVSNLDGLAFINMMNKKKEDLFIYLDPPYYLKGADLYMNFYSKKDHEALSKYVHKMKKRWMVSYDNHPFILNLYTEQQKVMYQLSQSASNRIGDEILIFSNQIEYKDSITTLKSPVLINNKIS